jgi:Alginate export
MLRKASIFGLGWAVLAVVSVPPALAEGDIDDLLIDGKFTFDARLRYENVDQDGFAQNASAPTVRLRAGFVTGKYEGFQGLVEGEVIGHLSDRFNDTVNGNATYPVVADPDGMELNRLQVEYTGLPQTVVTLGRQRINLDNQRFIGAVGFRQNEQTFDALRITNTSIDNVSLTYIFLNQTNRIFGNESLMGEYEGPSHLFNASYDLASVGNVTGYAYLLDLQEALAMSTATYGIRLAGKRNINDDVAIGYEAEYARQNDYADNPGDFDLNYWHGDVTLSYGEFALVGGVESLEGDGTRGFSTPLGTLHKFQGYADVFLTTPVNGIVDFHGKLGYSTKFDEPVGPFTGFAAAAWYHTFDAERGSASLGEEFDLEALARLGEHFAIGTKYANYDGDGGFASREKIWLFLEMAY